MIIINSNNFPIYLITKEYEDSHIDTNETVSKGNIDRRRIHEHIDSSASRLNIIPKVDGIADDQWIEIFDITSSSKECKALVTCK